jgi:hypothetical protein
VYSVKWWTGADVSAERAFSISAIKVVENGSIRPVFIRNILVYVPDYIVSLPRKSRQAAIGVTLNLFIELTP